MNTETNVQFPIDVIKRYSNEVNDVWKERMQMLLNYYKKNHISITQDSFEFTVLMDEPDRNLDIEHIKEIYNILSYRRPMTQLIVVLHNPVLIYKLSKLDVNIIELTPGYLSQIKSLIEDV